jgi:diacylglycerol kinase (ATP)
VKTYSSITIIYNPNSTGPGKKLATRLVTDLRAALPKQTIKLIATKAAGHAEKLSYDIAMTQKQPLIISVSGDGGYNEVINGAAQAYQEGGKPVTGLLPAGNANDHYESLHGNDFVQAITNGKQRKIDLLKLVAINDKKTITRYAHSYVGLGLSPKVGKQLTVAKLNRVNEVWIALYTWFKPHYITLKIDRTTGRYDSIIISNIDRMAKVLTLSQNSTVSDGKFEVSELKHRSRLTQILYLLRAVTVGLAHTLQTDTYHFETVKKTLAQLDGEVIILDAHMKVTVTAEQKLLNCIV